jgi:hypothetical protein
MSVSACARVFAGLREAGRASWAGWASHVEPVEVSVR